MGLDSSGPLADDSPRPIVVSSTDAIVAARRSLSEILEKSREAALSIDRSNERWRNLGDRLPALEAALKPLHSQSLLVKELEAKIDAAIAPTETVLKTFDLVHGLEKVIKGDPRFDTRMYLDAMSHLEEAVEHLARNSSVAVACITDAKDYLGRSNTADKYRMHRLNERLAVVQQEIASGGRWEMGLLSISRAKLDEAFRTILQESSKPIILPSSVIVPEDSSKPPPLPILLPGPVLAQLQMIVERLGRHKWADNMLETYRELRLLTIRESLRGLSPDYLRYSTPEKVDKVDWGDLEGMIDMWTQHIEVACKILFKSERRQCARVFEKLEKEKWNRCWGKLAVGFLPFLAFGEGVVQSQIAPEKLFKLLDMYDAMESLLPHVFEVFEGGEGCGEVRMRSRELLRKVAHRASETIWELGRFVEDGRGDAPPDGGRSRLCNYVVNYVKYMISEFYGPIMAKIVRIEKSWRDRAGDEENPDKWLSSVVTHVMQSLERHVVKKAKDYEDPSLANLFLLNNFWYMITRARDSGLGPLLGETWMRECKRKVQQFMMDYQRNTWGKALGFLSRDGLSASGSGKGVFSRDAVKQKVRNFTALFEENCTKHSKWVVPEQDLKEEIRTSVMQAVVPAYRGFISWGHLEQNGNIAKFMKFSADEVETMIGDLFEVRGHDSRPRIDLTSNSQHSSNVEIQSF